MRGKRLFVSLIRPVINRIIPPLGPKPIPAWQQRGASITVNGTDAATAVAETASSRDTLRSRDEEDYGGG